MKSKYKIIDNYLPEKEYLKIEKTFSDPFNLQYIPWMFSLDVGLPSGNFQVKDNIYHSYFVHNLFLKGEVCSKYIKVLDPLFKKLKVRKLTRAKVNLFLPTHEIHYFDTHVDSIDPYNTNAILYLNTCNGGTFIEEKTLIKSKRNRLLKIRSNVPHCSTSCTDSRYRMLININYNKQ
tara:strand:+ start:141 stop:671 length:531 start_codon:yes stop_codon:yes gene_type:complete